MSNSAAALLEPNELAELGPPEAIRLPLELIAPHPNNPRRELIEVDALAENIRAFGLLQPVTVRRMGDRYELLGGHRRYAAFQLLAEREPHDPQWRSIPAVVRTADDDRAFLMLLSSQLHNRSWRPREEAAALERLLISGRNLKQIGEALHRTESWASKRLRVYADAVLSGYVQTGRLATGVAEEMLSILDASVRKDFAERAVEEGWSQDHARGEVRALRADKMLKQISRSSRAFRELLSSVDAARIPDKDAQELLRLARLIMRMAGGGKTVFPSIDQAQRVAGVKTQEPTRRGRPKAKRRQRVMPVPA